MTFEAKIAWLAGLLVLGLIILLSKLGRKSDEQASQARVPWSVVTVTGGTLALILLASKFVFLGPTKDTCSSEKETDLRHQSCVKQPRASLGDEIRQVYLCEYAQSPIKYIVKDDLLCAQSLSSRTADRIVKKATEEK